MSKKPAEKVPAGEFKAKCLALLDEVARTGKPLVVTKHGKPVAQVIPLEGTKPSSLKGSVLKEKDLLSPVGGTWDAER